MNTFFFRFQAQHFSYRDSLNTAYTTAIFMYTATMADVKPFRNLFYSIPFGGALTSTYHHPEAQMQFGWVLCGLRQPVDS
jgi:hypothetical protein